MARAAELGCIIMPPMLTFYNRPTSIEDMIDHLVGKILMSFGLEFDRFRAWQGVD
jgi:4-hydroxy-3-polyprenylbenzoate decarboxylase